MKLIAQGAEAKIYLEGNRILKERISKGYRIKQIDSSIRQKTTRREAKIMQKAFQIINVPKLISSCDKKMIIKMEFIKGQQLKEAVDKMGATERQSLFEEIGKQVARLHNNGIMHGDLTTSNILLDNNKICFIDFGLGFFSQKTEDKAVDLHLFRQALNSKHYTHSEGSFDAFLQSYLKDSKEPGEITKRFIKVEERGRYKKKKGEGGKNA